jgi:hypothetical protein
MPAVLFRILVVALLALAVPLQGVASVVAGQCMMFGHHQDGAAQETHHHAGDGADGHDHAAHSHDDGAAKAQDGSAKNAHCGPCSACCASASIAGPVGLPVLSSSSTTKYVFSQLPSRGVPPHGLDRPPLAL